MPSPDTAPPDPSRPDEAAIAAEAARLRRADRARQAFVAPWSRRRARRVGVVALVLGILGPLAGTAVALLLVPAQAGDVLPPDEDRTALLDVRATVRTVDATSGEMLVRLVVERSATTPEEENDLFASGALTEEVVLVVNDDAGQSAITLPAGQPPGTATATIPLAESRATRYPVDRYRATLLVAALRDGDQDRPIPVRLSVRSSDTGFTLDVAEEALTDDAAIVELAVARRGTVIGWAGFFVLVCWLLAIASASLGWTTVVHGIGSPAWSWGFLIGVLFALPPLRNALPGNPPSGSLVDLAAFYWAVGIVALTLVAMVGSWNIRVRRAPQEPDSPTPRT
ncbi:DUF4436 family protein [Iamia sp. SCSIO 61187]|uniref:DUF4436 family protein n=1 Tax=Iamia sp. SCSIO 61187 TaxID=2722752 RepID=UPI001C637D00|nr:DUF4436 family protein [Iamia sp. SCSIO 61187]QYG94090.1 DUF4436 family protein [Iamia sp. SCSIO 61187]